jgi:hypothetical protein
MTCTPANPCCRVTGPDWTEDQCRWCWRKRYPKGNGESQRFRCTLRGSRIDKIMLPVCRSGRTGLVPVFSCPLHGSCIRYGTTDEVMLEFVEARKRGETPAIWQCNLCKERKPA